MPFHSLSHYLQRILTLAVFATTASAAAEPWQAIKVPGEWESQLGELDGFGWYRCFVDIPASWDGSRLLLTVKAVDDVDQAYVNGQLVGANGGMPPLFARPSSDIRRPAVVEPDQIRFGATNLIAFRVYDHGGRGGIIEGPIQLGRLADAIDLSGTWDFIAGDRQDHAHWPNQNPNSAASQALLQTYRKRHGDTAAGHRGVVSANTEGRQREMAAVRKRFEGNQNVHSNIAGKGPPQSPAAALDALNTAADLLAETVLHEPLVTQPLYTEFDARGRLWVTQYIQYPKPAGLRVLTWDNHLRTVFDRVPPPPPYDTPEKAPFTGRDKITIHEDTDGDGRFDHHKVFLDGMNIVTSTCQGDGGVWVLQPPYLLFYSDADADDQPDGDPVVHLSGFGLEDTHSVANSIKFGPDGWLYACTGSTVTARVRVASRPNAPPITFFGQNIWRYHPKTHRFELFAEGGWNTFGVDFDAQGRLFSGTNGSMQAVHFVQGGFYQKSFGKHGPHTNPHAFDYFFGVPIEGKHQRLVQQWLPYDADELAAYRGRLIGVNCLANRVPVLALRPEGSTFTSRELPAAIESSDVWFRPVHATQGPDGLVYVSDFYDARITHVDPRDNWDRQHGRIYRLRSPEKTPGRLTDLTHLDTAALVKKLDAPNQWHRWTARRLLAERADPAASALLRARLARDGQGALEALWTLHWLRPLSETPDLALAALQHPHPQVRLWGIRLLADDLQPIPESLIPALRRCARDPDPELISQLAASLQRIATPLALDLLQEILATERFTSDPFIPSQLWWALEAQITRQPDAVVAWLSQPALWRRPLVETKLAALVGRRLAADPSSDNLTRAAQLLSAAPLLDHAKRLIQGMDEALRGIRLAAVPPSLSNAVTHLASGEDFDLDLFRFAMRLGLSQTRTLALERLAQPNYWPPQAREAVLESLAEQPSPALTELLLRLATADPSPEIRRLAIHGLRASSNPAASETLLRLAAQADTPPEESKAVLTVLTGRADWAAQLVQAVASESIASHQLSLDQVLVMKGHADPELTAQIERLWPDLQQSNAEKTQLIQRTQKLLSEAPGNPVPGAQLFEQHCAACHRLFDRGAAIGPDLTGYDRQDRDFLVTAIIDPNLGIREEFELTTITLRPASDSQSPVVLSGFVKGLTDTQLTLMDLTGHQSTVATGDIVSKTNTPVSIMPEGLLAPLTTEQIRDLFAYLQAKRDPLPAE